MERYFKVTVLLDDIVAEGDDEESFREAVKDALREALEDDDNGEREIIFYAKEVEEQ